MRKVLTAKKKALRPRHGPKVDQSLLGLGDPRALLALAALGDVGSRMIRELVEAPERALHRMLDNLQRETVTAKPIGAYEARQLVKTLSDVRRILDDAGTLRGDVARELELVLERLGEHARALETVATRLRAGKASNGKGGR